MKAAGWKKYDKMHARKRENYMIDADKIKQLTQKLRTQGDISLEEADEIYFLSLQKLPGLSQALIDWYSAVSDEIKKGRRGNFIFTIDLSFDNALYFFMYPARRALIEQGQFEDLCTLIMIDKKLHSQLPFDKLLAQDNVPFSVSGKGFYVVESFRAGMYYYPISSESGNRTIKQIVEKFSPITTVNTSGVMLRRLLESVSRVASGECELSDYAGTLGRVEMRPYTIAFFMERRNIPCIAAFSIHVGKSIIFVEKEKAPIMKKALEIPFEALVEDALSKKIIDETMAKRLSNGGPASAILGFPFKKFIKNGVQYIDDIVQKKMEWKAAREEVEEEIGWLEEIR